MVLLSEEPVNEIKLISLTNWSWVLLLSTVILVVWLMIILQARAKGAHEFGLEPDSDEYGHSNDKGDERTSTDIIESEG
jgi:hypothetical protein